MDQELFQLAERLGQKLLTRKMKITVAESCTGGGICQVITEVPGSSAWFDRGFITYSNVAKAEMLAVNEASLEVFGAVSPEVAMEMAAGALRNSCADLAVAVTGIAGPGGGSEEKPVGTVYIAWKLSEQASHEKWYQFNGDRSEVRFQSICKALSGCLKTIQTSEDQS